MVFIPWAKVTGQPNFMALKCWEGIIGFIVAIALLVLSFFQERKIWIFSLSIVNTILGIIGIILIPSQAAAEVTTKITYHVGWALWVFTIAAIISIIFSLLIKKEKTETKTETKT